MDVKFAHRFDSPGCLNIQDASVEFGDNSVKITGKCTQASHKIEYLLDLKLSKEILPDKCTYTEASVGRMTITLEKANGPIYWEKL
jgi:hypothetical protein